jgi:hypothetical protein
MLAMNDALQHTRTIAEALERGLDHGSQACSYSHARGAGH